MKAPTIDGATIPGIVATALLKRISSPVYSINAAVLTNMLHLKVKIK